jgi:hypothetical protein
MHGYVIGILNSTGKTQVFLACEHEVQTFGVNLIINLAPLPFLTHERTTF